MNNRIVNVGTEFPAFDKISVVSREKGKEFKNVTHEDHKKNDQWMVMFWWPKDFTFVCPTEIAEFNKHYTDFRDRDTILFGACTDSEFVHLAWRNDHEDLKDLRLPMLADINKYLSEYLSIMVHEEYVYHISTF